MVLLTLILLYIIATGFVFALITDGEDTGDIVPIGAKIVMYLLALPIALFTLGGAVFVILNDAYNEK